MNVLENRSDLVFLAGFVVYVTTRGVFAHRVKAIETVEQRVGGIEIVLLVFVMIGSLILPILYLFTPLLKFANDSPPTWAQWMGVGVLLAALWLFHRSHADLGTNWSPTLEIRKAHRLVTKGVYRSIRHPMYAAILLFSLAQALLLHNWLAGYGALVTFLPLYIVRAPREERMMLDRFGTDYEAYMRRTGRLIPRVSKRP